THAERSRFDALILEDPAEAWRLIDGIDDDLGTRRYHGTLFFKTLAAHDPELAAQFLPGDAPMAEKADWISAICIAAVGKGNLELSQKLLNENFRGGGRSLAMAQIFPELFKSNEVSTVIEFWNSIDPGSEKDAEALTF